MRPPDLEAFDVMEMTAGLLWKWLLVYFMRPPDLEALDVMEMTAGLLWK